MQSANPALVTDSSLIFLPFPINQEKIEAINQALVNEYEVRRKMLLKRLDVTVQSFGWSDRAKVRLLGIGILRDICIVLY